jgi:probable H4MPT-linked C1 transfer pathway protein
MTQQHRFIGWDIGGAHLKVAVSNDQGELQDVIQLPCALWKGIDELQQSLKQALSIVSADNATHAITMTGELVDAFAHRSEGVQAILDCVSAVLPPAHCHIFAGSDGWLSVNEAKQRWQAVASMNWQASARYAASQIASGVFIDIGSTTCDIIPFNGGSLELSGHTDHERQREGSLVYTGAIRTPLMAITDRAPLGGQIVPLAADWFASSADIWCLLGKLSNEDIQDASADGQPWTLTHCRQRLARMLATDADAANETQWHQVAMWFAEKQLASVTAACLQQLSASALTTSAPLVGAGVGRFIVEACAQRLQRPYIDFSSLCDGSADAAAHAPAAALALLAQQQLS